MDPNFKRDNENQRKLRDRILVPAFYQECYAGRYILLDGDAPLTQVVQRRGADTLLVEEGMPCWVEEKIVNFPTNGSDGHTAFAIELKSDGYTGTPGWYRKCEADILIYCFALSPEPVSELGMWWIPFQPFKAWFDACGENSFPPFGPCPGAGRLVPIHDVETWVPGVVFELLREPKKV